MNASFCRCGRPALPDDHLCARCRYYDVVFHPRPPILESKREMAQEAIRVRKVMKRVKMMEVE